MIDNKLELSFL